jgi:hypothetical protein
MRILREFNEVMSDEKIPKADEDFTTNTIGDTYFAKDVLLLDGVDASNIGRVTKCLRDAKGRPIGVANENPLLGMRDYAIEFRDFTHNLTKRASDTCCWPILLTTGAPSDERSIWRMRLLSDGTALSGGDRQLKVGSCCASGRTAVLTGLHLRMLGSRTL